MLSGRCVSVLLVFGSGLFYSICVVDSVLLYSGMIVLRYRLDVGLGMFIMLMW